MNTKKKNLLQDVPAFFVRINGNEMFKQWVSKVFDKEFISTDNYAYYEYPILGYPLGYSNLDDAVRYARGLTRCENGLEIMNAEEFMQRLVKENGKWSLVSKDHWLKFYKGMDKNEMPIVEYIYPLVKYSKEEADKVNINMESKFHYLDATKNGAMQKSTCSDFMPKLIGGCNVKHARNSFTLYLPQDVTMKDINISFTKDAAIKIIASALNVDKDSIDIEL